LTTASALRPRRFTAATVIMQSSSSRPTSTTELTWPRCEVSSDAAVVA
jgi:hypothetical protein